MKKLIHVVRGRPDTGAQTALYNSDSEPVRLREPLLFVNPTEVNNLETAYTPKSGEFFLVNELDVDVVLPVLASINPGCEVRVYGAELVAQCPPAAMVMKKVSSHGILPNI